MDVSVDEGGDEGTESDMESSEPDILSGPPREGLTRNVQAEAPLSTGSFEDVTTPRVLGLIYGDKGTGKTISLSRLPVDEGQKIHILTFDETTVPSLVKFYQREKSGLSRGHIEWTEATKPEPEIGYGGFSVNEPKSGVQALGMIQWKLQELKKRDDIDWLVLDMFNKFYDKIAPTAVKGEENYDMLAELQIQDYSKRKSFVMHVEEAAREVPERGLFLTGYGAQEKTDMKRKEGGSTKVVTEVKPPKWPKYFKDDYNVQLRHRVTSEEDQSHRNQEGSVEKDYWVDVLDSRHPNFPDGARLNVTDKGYQRFFEEEGLEGAADALVGEEEVELADEE
jgi:hypothetical protein